MSTIEQAIQSRQDTVPAPAREFDREQWKAQKQQELEETFQLLNDETMQLLNNPAKYKAFLELQAKLPALSVGNALLILNQKTDQITQLASFKDWQEQGRSVKRGETGCRVLVPVNYKREDGSEGTSFRVGRVFDISQTHGDPIAPIQKQVIKLDQLVRMMVEMSPVRVIADQTISAQRGALFDPASKSIHVRSDLPDTVAVEVLAREMSNATLSAIHDDYDRDEKIFASSSAAYLIGKRYGYEPTDFDPEMIQDFNWPNDPVIIRAALNDARQAANMVCQRIDRGLDPQQQDPKQAVRNPTELTR